MIVEACDDCKKLNTEVPLLYFAEYTAANADDYLKSAASPFQPTAFTVGISLSTGKTPRGRVFCPSCLTVTIQKSVKDLQERA